MTEPAIEWLAVLISAVMLLAGPIGILAGYRVYSPEQRGRADLLYHGYLCVWVVVSIVGTATLVWIAIEGLRHPWLSMAQSFMLVPLFLVQWRMHERMGYTGWLDEALLN